MNDHLNEINIPEDGLAPDELSLLKDALNTAWPPPKTSIRDGVMAQIRQERMTEKRRRFRSRMVKIGSLAACLVLIAMAGIRVLPSLTGNSADMAAEACNTAADYAPAETVPETAAMKGSDEGGEAMKTMMFSAQMPSDSVTAADAEPAEAEEAAVEEAVAETSPETLLSGTSLPGASYTDEECVIECEAEEAYDYTADIAEACAESLTTVCAHSGVFADSYHTIPELIIACTGEDVYLAWLDGTDGCDRNIAEYMEYMKDNTDLVLPEIQLIYDATDLWYQYDWNFDLLESGDAAAIEEYYGNGGDFAGMVKRATEYCFKLALLDETGAEMTVDVCAWSIADLVEAEGMTLSTLTAVYEASADEIEVTYPGYAAQEYDLAALHDYAYSPENDEPTLPDALAPGRHEDALFRTDSVK